ncbi:OmpA family protein [Bacteroides pyogenes]|uniref:OmpA family protein n=1 Tax=Bacteroides pyogenes TaxID=310300 RepID=UPI0024330A22|nr:DUF3868 domain-containing protein [Bacteroides pyogenes]MCI7069827.1 DUF3868 domain-containing protein [Bacteroides pyogenes]
MNKYFSTIILSALLAGASSVYAQKTAYTGGIGFDTPQIERKDNQIHATFNIILDSLRLKRQSMLTLTPMLVSADGNQVRRFTPVMVGSRVPMILYKRGELSPMPAEPQPEQMIRRRNSTSQHIPIEFSIPFEEWMRSASIQVDEYAGGCAMCEQGYMRYKLTDRLLSERYVPQYTVAYVTPEPEPVKVRSDRFVARFNFVVGRYELLRDFQGNAREFARVDSVARNIMGNKDLTVTNVAIDGYASPEGSYTSNLTLSRNRAQAFVEYLARTYGLQSNLFKVTGHGEDWDGLVKAVEASGMEKKEEVLDIIDRYSIEGGREAKLMALSAGNPYRYMLTNFYPPLRRTEYAFTYNVRPFSVEEAREVIKTKPALLSLNEMYLVANSYPEGSRDREEVLETAANVYPDNPVSRLNLMASRLNANRTNAVEEALIALGNMPEAQNNLGILYARRGENEKAKACFRKAGDLQAARHNLQELEKAEKDQ